MRVTINAGNLLFNRQLLLALWVTGALVLGFLLWTDRSSPLQSLRNHLALVASVIFFFVLWALVTVGAIREARVLKKTSRRLEDM